MNWNILAFLTLAALALSLLLAGLTQIWHTQWGKSATRIKQRMRFITGELAVESRSLMKKRLLSQTPFFDAMLNKVPRMDDMDTLLTQAGVSWSMGQFLLTGLLLWLGTFITTWVMLGLGAAWLLASVPIVLSLLFLQHSRHQRVVRIEAQLPDTLDLMARAMQAGHAFSSAVLIVGTEGMQPIRGEFQTTFDEINFGIPTATALQHLTQRVASSDLRFFVVAVLIQLETGGNLSEILKSLSALIRDRQRIAGSVRVLTAEGRLSAWILGLLPFVIALLLTVINPEFISKLWTDPLGILMLQVSLSLMAIGVWWMWHMVRIRI
jgi:tight adherence protein B